MRATFSRGVSARAAWEAGQTNAEVHSNLNQSGKTYTYKNNYEQVTAVNLKKPKNTNFLIAGLKCNFPSNT